MCDQLHIHGGTLSDNCNVAAVRETKTVNEDWSRVGIETQNQLIYMMTMRLVVLKRLLALGLLLIAALGVSGAFPLSAYAHGGAHRSA